MNPKGLKKVDQQVIKAERAFDRLCATSDPNDSLDAWDDFLTAAGKIYSKLKVAAMVSGSSMGWYGKKQKERKDDPLLSYVHHARDCETHGIEDSAVPWISHRFTTILRGPFMSISVPEGESISDVVGILPDGERVPIQTRQSRTFRLVAVYDSRHSVTFDVPKTHRGEQLPGGLEPAYIAGLALNYIKELVQEAWTRVE